MSPRRTAGALIALGALCTVAWPTRAQVPDLDGLDAGEARRRAEAEERARPRVSVAGDDAARRLDALEAAVPRRPTDVAARFALARQLHLHGVDGDEDAHDRGLELLLAVRRARPGPRVDAWLGSARLLEARYTLAFWNKAELVEEGLTLLDGAVRSAPDDVEVRFLRALATYHLPFFFDRKDGAAADLAWVAARARAAVQQGALTPPMGAAALFVHGVVRHERGAYGEAQAAWRQAVELAPASAHGRAAAARLSGA